MSFTVAVSRYRLRQHIHGDEPPACHQSSLQYAQQTSSGYL